MSRNKINLLRTYTPIRNNRNMGLCCVHPKKLIKIEIFSVVQIRWGDTARAYLKFSLIGYSLFEIHIYLNL